MATILGLASGCTCEVPRTQVMVEVDAQQAIRLQTTEVVVEVRGGTREVWEPMPALRRSFVLSEADVDWPIRLALVPSNQDPSRRFEVTAYAMNGTTEVTSAFVRSGFVDRQSLLLRVTLWDLCEGNPCVSMEQACDETGACVDPVVEPTELPTLEDAGAGDAGGASDAGAPDAGASDAGPCDTPCDPVRQCGCVAAEACYADFSGLRCAPAGSVGEDQPCTTDEGCGQGLGCFEFLGVISGVCTPYCTRDVDCSSEPGAVCLLGETADPSLGRCSTACEPDTNAGCPPGYACDTWSIGASHTFCRAAGTETAGYVCGISGSTIDPEVCDAQHYCLVDPMDAMRLICMLKCVVGGPPCPAGQSCWRINMGGTIIGGVEYGVCGTP